jgi:hypothetical protein
VARLFSFIQFEFPNTLGPDPGRYLVVPANGRVDEAAQAELARIDPDRITGVVHELGAADVLQLQVAGAPAPKGGLIFRKPKTAVSGEDPREVSLLVATLIKATEGLDGRREARRFLETIKAQQDRQEEFIEEMVAVLNTAIRAFRAAARDPYLTEIAREDSREVRIGYGSAQDLTAGQWQEAFALPPPRRQRISRAERLKPTEAVSLALDRSLPLLDAEDLALRVMLDLQQNRTRAAAVQLRACADLLVAELTDASHDPVIAERRDVLAEHARSIENLANHALDNLLPEGAEMELEEALGAVEDALEAWREDAARVVDPDEPAPT